MELRYLYVGSSDTGRDVEAWLLVPGAQLRWRFQHFGADVAAIDLGTRPAVLLADHRPTGSVLPIYAVDDLDGVIAEIAGRGWTVEAQGFGTPEGPAAVLRDPSGTEIALLRVDRPTAMEAAYAYAGNTHAVR
ncbi:MAG TPA: hypothetical protein VF076_07555 [Acidimicrobiales bacterium]